MTKPSTQLDELSVFVHGALAALHILGIVYNAKKRNHWDVCAHTAAAAYDLYAVRTHLHNIARIKELS